jgi:CubicO group peptidase (beta-lactamase class C family)
MTNRIAQRALLLGTVLLPFVPLLGAFAQQAGSVAPAKIRELPTDSAVLAIIKQRVEEKRSTGILVGLLEPSGRTRIVAFGDPGPGQPPLDGNTVFEIGSISKVFTATALAELVKEGKVKLDDPVQKYLPSVVHVPSRNGKEITLGSLSTQNSGLPRMPSNFRPSNPANPYADYTVQQMYDFVSGTSSRAIRASDSSTRISGSGCWATYCRSRLVNRTRRWSGSACGNPLA